jgi:ankyrin repeat protein
VHLNKIPFEPNSRYQAVGRRSLGGGARVTAKMISLETDHLGRVVRFSDLTTNDVSLADMWEYLEVTNVATGEVMDLRLHTAAANDDVELAKEALAEGVDLSLRIQQGAMPLHWAAACGNIEVARLLIEAGADVNAADAIGWTPLFLAVREEHQQLAVMLHAAGASLTAVVNGKEITMSFDEDWDEKLLRAVAAGNEDGVRDALENGADVNCTTGDGWTPLLEAAKGPTEIVELLLAEGADPNIASGRGYTPLMRAAGNDREKTVRLLLAAGADTTMQDCDGKTAARLAREMGHHRCADLVAG